MLFAAILLSLAPLISAAAGTEKCIPSGDERAINEAFLLGG